MGGPRFLGRALADGALARRHEVTFFNRGQTNPELDPKIERLQGDRAGDLRVLAGREWDAVIDTSGYLPNVVRASAEALAGCGRYCFISSISVYGDFSVPVDEESPLATLGDLSSDEVTNESYGPLKALCEQVVRESFEGRALVVRPGLIVGPHDPIGRFTYWPIGWRVEARFSPLLLAKGRRSSSMCGISASGSSTSASATLLGSSTRRTPASPGASSWRPVTPSRGSTRRSRRGDADPRMGRGQRRVKIWLDDIRDAPPGWVRAFTPEQVIGLLQLGKVTALALDHDLGLGLDDGASDRRVMPYSSARG